MRPAAIVDLVQIIFDRLKLTLHPEKTRKVDLTDGKGGFDFLGCHLHKRTSGKLLETTGIRRYRAAARPLWRSDGLELLQLSRLGNT